MPSFAEAFATRSRSSRSTVKRCACSQISDAVSAIVQAKSTSRGVHFRGVPTCSWQMTPTTWPRT
jgi:hypothetical protein